MAINDLVVMNKFLLALALGLFSIALGKAQDLEQEIEFRYIKAKYLLDTERYEDAIKAFSNIVTEEVTFKDALLLRAKAKYAMAAYKGTKKDILLFADNSGMNAYALTLLGKADYKMGKTDAALNSLQLVGEIGTSDVQVLEFIGNIYQEKDELLKACDYWQKAASMGSSKARINAKKVCGSTFPSEYEEESRPQRSNSKINDAKLPNRETQVPSEDTEMKNNNPEKSENNDDGTLGLPTRDTVLSQGQKPELEEEHSIPEDVQEDEMGGNVDDVPVEVLEEELMPDEDDTPYEIVIDEDLTLVIKGQGLGKRRILDQPNILILSEEDGVVAIDICVNKRGKVETAEFNSRLSSISIKSLVSLSIRKSKDFWFEKSDYKEQCGVILFKIKGS